MYTEIDNIAQHLYNWSILCVHFRCDDNSKVVQECSPVMDMKVLLVTLTVVKERWLIFAEK